MHPMKYIYITFLTALFCACYKPTDKELIQKAVEEWQGKHLELPRDMEDFLTGNTIDLNDADFTILTYVDSTGCTGCKMKLPLWKEFLNSLDTVCDLDIRFLMIVNSSNIRELRYLLKRDSFDYPVYIDSNNNVAEFNSIPKEHILQTFLLDENEKVLAIGNPVYSSKIEKLYKNIISDGLSLSTNSKNTISVIDKQISLGNLNVKESKTREIVFSNHGNDTIWIDKVISSCDCTQLSFPKGFIAPKSDIKATLLFAGDTLTGNFERTIHVYYSDFEYPTIITVLGNIMTYPDDTRAEIFNKTKQLKYQ